MQDLQAIARGYLQTSTNRRPTVSPTRACSDSLLSELKRVTILRVRLPRFRLCFRMSLSQNRYPVLRGIVQLFW